MAKNLKAIYLSALIGGMLGNCAYRYHRNHGNDESGTIINKSNYELMIDINNDNKADRVIQFPKYYDANLAYYNYAQVGDKISYSNTWKKDSFMVGFGYNEIRKIEGKSAKEILKWNEMLKHAKMKVRY